MIRITREPLDHASITEAVRANAAGAVCTFLGTARALSDGKAVSHLDYDAYPEMAEKKLAEIETELRARWPVSECQLVHRLGRLELGEISVVVAVSCPHRVQAFEACRFGIDRIKEVVPIWKKETWTDGSSEWVDPTQRAADSK